MHDKGTQGVHDKGTQGVHDKGIQGVYVCYSQCSTSFCIQELICVNSMSDSLSLRINDNTLHWETVCI